MGRIRGLVVVAIVALLAGCAQFPADPHGTLDRVTGGTLRVGVSQHEPWVETLDAGDPQGTEPDLIRDFASELGAEVEWTESGEEQLMEALERGELDMVVGGFTDQTPWEKFGAVTRPYAEEERDGKTRKHVMVVRMGENAFQVELEGFLLEQGGTR